ncbi:MAG: A24 family peptidase [Gammaproteobacteria bacterium]
MTEIHNLLQTQPAALYILVGLLSLCIGSLLNVIIYRLPIMLQQQWQAECRDYLDLPEEADQKETTSFNLFFPRSHCPHCKKIVKAWHNIPILSYCLLRGRCAYCRQSISIRYPCIEFLTLLLSLFVVWMFGYSWQSVSALLFSWSLLCLVMIDIDHKILPDVITLPLLWLGLLISINHVFVSSSMAIIGAIAAYAFLWLFIKLFKLLTGKEGMGHGDFKLFAVFGAWLGWQMLPLIIVFASITGAIFGAIILLCTRQHKSTPIPFGPYLAMSAWVMMFWGQDLMRFYLDTMGI